MFKNVVVSIDGSAPSFHALAVAADIAKQYEAKLIITHAIMSDATLAALVNVAESHGFLNQIKAELDDAKSVKLIPGPIAATSTAAIPERVLKKVGTLLLKEATSKARSLGVDKTEAVLLGPNAAREILHLAEVNDADIIVCGTRGLGAIKTWFLGSVSRKILEEAKCPCLTVK